MPTLVAMQILSATDGKLIYHANTHHICRHSSLKGGAVGGSVTMWVADLLYAPRTRTSYCDRSFAVCGPTVCMEQSAC